MTVDVLTWGETMALFAPDPPRPLTEAQSFVLSDAGAESNVAISLVRLGSTAAWCSRLGDDPLGRRVLADIGASGVDTAQVRLTASSTGLLIKNPGPNGTSVLYYRAGSAASEMDETDVDRAMTRPCRAVHVTGITPALSATCSAAFDHAFDVARRRGVPISFDVNYRPALWVDRDTAARRLLQAASRADVVFVGLDEARSLWDIDHSADVRTLIGERGVVIVKDGGRAATAFSRNGSVTVSAPAVELVEAVGAGDAFAAGWLHGWLTRRDAEESLRLGHLVAAATLRSASDHGDWPTDRIHALARADASWPPAHDWRHDERT